MSAETQRGIAFERIVRIAQTLRGLRYGLTVDSINRIISDQTGHDWHARTTCRDLLLLEILGVVERQGERWRWCVVGGLFEQSPSAIGAAADRQTRGVASGRLVRRDTLRNS